MKKISPSKLTKKWEDSLRKAGGWTDKRLQKALEKLRKLYVGK